MQILLAYVIVHTSYISCSINILTVLHGVLFGSPHTVSRSPTLLTLDIAKPIMCVKLLSHFVMVMLGVRVYGIAYKPLRIHLASISNAYYNRLSMELEHKLLCTFGMS